MFGFSALSEAPFSTLPVSGGAVLFASIDEEINFSSVESCVGTFVGAVAEEIDATSSESVLYTASAANDEAASFSETSTVQADFVADIDEDSQLFNDTVVGV